MKRGRSRLLIVILRVSLGTTDVFGQNPQQSGTVQPGQPKENLAGAVVDPTAEIKTLTLQYKYAPSHWGIDEHGEEVDLQMGIPHRAFGKANILRVTVPYLTSTPVGNQGLIDVAVFDIVLFRQGWGTLALGAVSTFAPDKGTDTDMFAIGPAIGLNAARDFRAIAPDNCWSHRPDSPHPIRYGELSLLFANSPPERPRTSSSRSDSGVGEGPAHRRATAG